jgi:acetyltransferase-like isoleucine patch superfamily enzyme
MTGNKRWRFYKWGGVKFTSSHPRVWIYEKVDMDSVHPEFIEIGNNVRITSGCKIITHYLDPTQKGVMFRCGKVIIEDNVFFGMNTIICNNVTIGEGSIVGAGSVVTKNIPPYQVWAGNPAKYIKERVH